MPLSLVLDILIAVLLVITIGYAMVLNRRLAGLRKNKDELETLFATFSETTNKAQESAHRLRATSTEIEAALGSGTSEARSLREDLAYLIERGTELADRLEGDIRGTRKDAQSGASDQPATAATREKRRPSSADNSDMPEPSSEAERELLKALQSVR